MHADASKSTCHFSANQDKRPKICIPFFLKRKNPGTIVLTRQKVAKSKKAQTLIFNDCATLFVGSTGVESQLEGPSGVQVAIGGQLGGPNGVQVALGGQLEGPNGVQVALGVRLGRPSGAQEAPSCAWRAAWSAKWSPTWRL